MYQAYMEKREEGLTKGWLEYNEQGELKATKRLHKEASYHEAGMMIMVTAFESPLLPMIRVGPLKAGPESELDAVRAAFGVTGSGCQNRHSDT
jgi:hypothetical protein